MFHHIEGTVSELEPGLAVIDCGGIGFALSVTANTMASLHPGERAKLFVAESIGENNFDLYGFYDRSERRFFELLITISGVGPKAAMSILSHNTPEGLAMAIIGGDEKALTVAPGIGRKIAQRVILELKDKLSREMQSSAAPVFVPAAASPGVSAAVSDALAGLAVLGYTGAEISPVLRKLDTGDMSAEQIVRAVLKQMVK